MSVVRLAWLATFVVPLVLTGLLLAVKTSHASPAGKGPIPLALEEEVEDEGEPAEDACETAEDGSEEDELEEVEVEVVCEEAEDSGKRKAAVNDSVAPEKCLVRSANARVVAYTPRDTVRLTLGYTTYAPTAATVDYSFSGGRGSLRIDTVKRHLGRSGVLRLTKSLSDAQMAKVQPGGHFTVRLHSAEAPGSCSRFETEQLSVKHASKRLAVWSQ